MKSAIGEKLTRKDHGDVSNQLVRFLFLYSPSLSLSLWRTWSRIPKTTGTNLLFDRNRSMLNMPSVVMRRR